jgi:hypothetical protein
VALNEKDCRGGAVLERWLLADKREPTERILSMCALRRGGDSTASLLPALLLDGPERARARLDIVSGCCCWRRFFMEVDSEVWVLPVTGGCGIGFSPLLLEPFPSEDEGSPDGVMVVRGKPIAVSDLCRGSVGDPVSVADALTPAEAESDRR